MEIIKRLDVFLLEADQLKKEKDNKEAKSEEKPEEKKKLKVSAYGKLGKVAVELINAGILIDSNKVDKGREVIKKFVNTLASITTNSDDVVAVKELIKKKYNMDV